MSSLKRYFLVMLVLSVMGLSASSQTRGYQQNARQLVLQLEMHTDTFRNSLNAAISQGAVDNTRRQENVSYYMSNFTDAIRRLHDRLNRREASAVDAQEVLNTAAPIDRFIRRQSLDLRTQRYWTTVRADLDRLAGFYSVSWPTTGRDYQRDQNYPIGPGYSVASLTGTYRLDVSRSDDPNRAADRALRSLSYSEQQRTRDQLMRRLEAPDEIAIEVRGRNVSLASTRAPQITFDADGREHIETVGNARMIQSVATLSGNRLSIHVTGQSDSQFDVSFSPIENGRSLNVVRRVYVTGLNGPVETISTYERTADVARFDIFHRGTNYPADESTSEWLLRNGETVIAELNTRLSTALARNGDSFTAVVRQPTQYAGATIEGHVSDVQRSGRITGRAQMTFNFDRIRLRNGQSYRFAGIVDGVLMPNGETARIDNEGAIREESQTNNTIERTAIGTAVGALIGAIAGGGKGAAIGAVIGAGTGAGSVYVQGRDDLDLQRGTEITIQATGPNR